MNSKLAFRCAGAVLAMAASSLPARPIEAGLVVHEWGTFTSLQDETGAAIGGINTDDEPVPEFVHRQAAGLLLNPTELPPFFFKGTPRCHPDVTMRLETPVIYFHPDPTAPSVSTLSVRVKFNGGWLSEFYPGAESAAPGLKPNFPPFGRLQSDTVSSLAWNDLELGGDWDGPETSAHVWTSPRAVRAAAVRATNGEAERFLFYRGVGHLDAPLRISSGAGQLALRSQLGSGLRANCPMPIQSLWLVDIQAGGKLAFKTLPAITLEGDDGRILATASSGFDAGDYRSRNLADLTQSLQAALVSEGLFNDEARALLNTWELSYFKSSGLRVFFLVPRAWTDAYLPLEISAPAQIQRVMVGRIELVTPAQREILRQLRKCPARDLQKGITQFQKQINQPGLLRNWYKLNSGQTSLNDAEVIVPTAYQLYLRLGRFRNTLLLREQAQHPSENLRAFIAAYRLSGYQPVEMVNRSN